MADGLNQARALRVTEIMTDFRRILSFLASIRINPSAEEYNEEGFQILRRCVAQGQALLQQPFQAQPGSTGDEEEVKANLQRIIIDASVRRFKAQRLYLLALAGLRWVSSRAQILQGQRPHAGHAPALLQLRNTLRAELGSVTDQRIELSLRTADIADGHWLDEDPGLALLQQLSRNGG